MIFEVFHRIIIRRWFRSKRGIFSQSIIIPNVNSTITNKHSITATTKQNTNVSLNIKQHPSILAFFLFVLLLFVYCLFSFRLLVVVVLYTYYVWGTVGDWREILFVFFFFFFFCSVFFLFHNSFFFSYRPYFFFFFFFSFRHIFCVLYVSLKTKRWCWQSDMCTKKDRCVHACVFMYDCMYVRRQTSPILFF